MSCTHCTIRELLPLFGHVTSLQLSLVLGHVASLLSSSSPPPHGGPHPRASSLLNGSVAVSGNRRSSGPGGPAALYCTISWHHRSIQSARRKVVTSFRFSLPRTSQVVSLVLHVSLPSLCYSYLYSPWPQPRAPQPSSPPPLRGTSFGRVVVLLYLGDSGWTWTRCNAGWSFWLLPLLFKAAYRPLVFTVLWFSLRVFRNSFCVCLEHG